MLHCFLDDCSTSYTGALHTFCDASYARTLGTIYLSISAAFTKLIDQILQPCTGSIGPANEARQTSSQGFLMSASMTALGAVRELMLGVGTCPY